MHAESIRIETLATPINTLKALLIDSSTGLVVAKNITTGFTGDTGLSGFFYYGEFPDSTPYNLVFYTGNYSGAVGAVYDPTLITEIAGTSSSFVPTVSGTGTGPISWVVTMQDEDENALPGVEISYSINSEVFSGTTDENGRITFNVTTTGNYTVRAALIGYAFTETTQSVTESGSKTHTMTLQSISPGTTGVCACYGTILNKADTGGPISGATFLARVIEGAAGQIIRTKDRASSASNAQGVAVINLPRACKAQFSYDGGDWSDPVSIPNNAGPFEITKPIYGETTN